MITVPVFYFTSIKVLVVYILIFHHFIINCIFKLTLKCTLKYTLKEYFK